MIAGQPYKCAELAISVLFSPISVQLKLSDHYQGARCLMFTHSAYQQKSRSFL